MVNNKITSRKEQTLIALKGGVPTFVPCYFQDFQLMLVTPMGEFPPLGQSSGYDAWGVHLTCPSAGTGFTPTPSVPPVLTDVTKWQEQVKFPNYSQVDWQAAYQADEEQFRWDRTGKVLDLRYPNGLFERLHFLMGFEDALCAFYEEPEAVSDLIAAIADTKISFIRHALPIYRPDVFTFLDDYAHQSGLFLSIEMFRIFFKPHLQRIVDAVHEEGALCKLHCCGKMDALAQEYMDLGADAVDPVMCINDVSAMKEVFQHKVGIVGGLDMQNIIDNVSATEEQVRAEVCRCIDTDAPGGGYIMFGSSINMRNPDAWSPHGCLGAVIDECAKYGADFYAK